ncbi:toprim domain-containing protein [Phaeodactylibacter sp.]|uniref:toprim domain-containing protein n=1 Tax=Phaeodactylibacter sp. TaxID=1940289 RepID=UPI0025D4CB01|nr:toprim domain-containing protein [Phaeodactylibacter sp.]MCI5091193.1 toprim domain-containing protein [Phaeodactylibacter sp.]
MSEVFSYNAQWAKENISLPELLSVFGHEPVKITKSGHEYWYNSPFRYEKEPSFHTSYLGGKWIWNDFGRGDVKGNGNVIGFLKLHENVSVSESLNILRNLFPHRGQPISWNKVKKLPLFENMSLAGQGAPSQKDQGSLKIESTTEKIWDKALIGYLAGERCINHKLALPYLACIKYTNAQTGKSYQTLGFANESGDYECRDKYFKGILKAQDAHDRNTAKDISFIPGSKGDEVAVFEGFMDFLTVLTIKNIPVLPVDVVVLNMVNMRRRAMDFIRSQNYQAIYTFFDNDSAGEKTTKLFQDELGDVVKPQNHLYQGYKDYNQHWQEQQKAS